MRIVDNNLLDDLNEIADVAVHRPGTTPYEAASRVFNGAAQGKPAGVVVPATERGVALALARLSDVGAPTVVRSGGHNITGIGSLSDAVTLDLRKMATVSVDPLSQTARVGGGASWAQLDAATSPWSLATTGGTFDTTGVAGLTLGGGIGHLMSSLGLACDRLLAARVVSTDGRIMEVDDEHEPELMWALSKPSGEPYRARPLGCRPACRSAALATTSPGWPSGPIARRTISSACGHVRSLRASLTSSTITTATSTTPPTFVRPSTTPVGPTACRPRPPLPLLASGWTQPES